MPTVRPKPRAIDLIHAEISRQRRHLYQVAAAASIHPSTISKLLSGKLELTPVMEKRLWRALNQETSIVD
jgi:plasmid maintenance system antidote protein VapI